MRPRHFLITGLVIILAAGLFNAAFLGVPNPDDTAEIAARRDMYQTICGVLCGLGFTLAASGALLWIMKMSKNL